ncbi:MAG: pyruvate kinase [Candidatus Omnitrophica bacterium]|nr:pyruvate kinase [Candidatus Omnitrophota bacterium]
MKKTAKTKIICTIGPVSGNETVLRKMMLCGMDVARLNFSHGSHPEHLKRIEMIRKLNRKYRRRIRILQDLEGYRIRIGELKPESGIPLKKRQRLFLTREKIVGDGAVIPFDYEGDLKAIKKGRHIFIDDGYIALLVKRSGSKIIETEVLVPGVLKEHKGVNIPDVSLKFKGLTDKDREDIHFGIRHGVDYIAQSFVRDASDILPIRQMLGEAHPDCKIIAKIENRQGIKNIDEIIEVCDGIMIARGDMGVSLPIYEIPVMQKRIIRKCNRAKRFVITATQMLESMTEHIRPTRAEVTDVANAILDGSDFVMLSAETAAGKYPAETVRMMNQIIKFTEGARFQLT